jgi:hypothetical protein
MEVVGPGQVVPVGLVSSDVTLGLVSSDYVQILDQAAHKAGRQSRMDFS